ncbi:protocatechuate 3,4-dioxygenase subunit alpha [Tomitella gaofuii]|uniref:protocatechuate 3,4-dioxygenase subunit alpha n=1 Tax=Tomitella gaofuii TaxID=2760083 RepID=UPI0015FC0D92|nr:protocatechuate 3,4-dioxygenase subunit alpha [Tomitella gaofuii]
MPDLHPTPGQTIGPFFSDPGARYGLSYVGDNELVPPTHPRAVVLHGTVYDGAGQSVPDALIEIRQADERGVVPEIEGAIRRDGTVFTGWGRTCADPAGRYRFVTLAPGSADGAPFFAVTVFARGLLDRLFTRAYVPDDDAASAADPVLSSVPPERRDTLIAVREDMPGAAAAGGALRFDIRLQDSADGPETVFLDFPRHRVPGA